MAQVIQQVGDLDVEVRMTGNVKGITGNVLIPFLISLALDPTMTGGHFDPFRRLGAEPVGTGQHDSQGFHFPVGHDHGAAGDMTTVVYIGPLANFDIVEGHNAVSMIGTAGGGDDRPLEPRVQYDADSLRRKWYSDSNLRIDNRTLHPL